ncbi:MAG: peptidoglycan DD-metalloendopeptidase family protein, partial [Sideroxydans sp.]|nr:peptidoglycan DD-metalloendopeptidase family protein [Sideroxydans sp.]
ATEEARMLPQNTLLHAHKMKLRWFITLSTLPLLGVLTAFGIMPQTVGLSASQYSVFENITLPVATEPSSEAAVFWRNDRVQRGDTVSELLRRVNVQDPAADEFLRRDASVRSFRQLRVGRTLLVETDDAHNLLALRYTDNDGNHVKVLKDGASFRVTEQVAETERRVFVQTGEIASSLYAATDEAGLPDSIANQLVEVFGGDIDFHRDLRRHDKFSVVYEMDYLNGESTHKGRILAAEFVNHGRTFRAFYFENSRHGGDYFSPDGKSMRKAFLRSPIEFSRVSSGFSRSRFHPVLNKWRAHKGVDYAAPIGTKVRATADGIVSFVGTRGGYGNVIIIEHQGHFQTVYGHLSRFAASLHRGQRIAQGEVIGYVGKTGLASGPHLHYEFKVSGIQRDPLKIALPDGKPISEAQRTAFTEATRDLHARLSLLRNTRIAKLD